MKYSVMEVYTDTDNDSFIKLYMYLVWLNNSRVAANACNQIRIIKAWSF